ncbi:glycerol kinase [Paenibacillus sp. MMS20-IR301]|uniref:FGGY family carbohydrate kinase n=1 Tax=Paenibacillus sp. MMS20-IR301 TaxID=2895946 RepID=UPI0028F0611E|nr:glycerol kinase [Paenibacillus sp. MMS20-IR301]WNS45255.1 glycerol kinase [Paenibacillus sp. MMS20-IR301]
MELAHQYILAIDQSTSGTKALLVNHQGEIIARAGKEHRQYYPQPGWVEHDPLEIYGNVKETARLVLAQAGVAPSALAALTITNQRETALMWDKVTGLPVHHAVVWQCQRTAETCARLKQEGHESAVRAATGLMLDPYFSAAKFKWILDHADGAAQLLSEDRLLAGTMDSWLIWKLTGGASHTTDYSNASRTSLYNIHTLAWDEQLSAIFGVPLSILPEVRASDTVFGYTADPDLFAEQVPVSGVIGDSQGALYGHLCFDLGCAKATYGTGTSVMMNIGSRPVDGGEGLVTAIAWGAGGTVTYALEAVIRTTGDSIKWTRDNLGLFSSFAEMQQLVDGTDNNEGVYLVPAFVGLGAPYWEPDARAAILGMNRGTGRGHILRAALESTAYQVRDAVEFIQERSGTRLLDLRTDGGASANPWLMSFQADILGRPVKRSGCAELSAMGSVYLGGLGTGFWPNPEAIQAEASQYEDYLPHMDETARARNYSGWQEAVEAVTGKAERTKRVVTTSS